ncbi:hypothetical protein ACP4OV_018456 [Aristida adscensionis]
MAAVAIAWTSQKGTATCLLALLLTGLCLAYAVSSTEARLLTETSDGGLPLLGGLLGGLTGGSSGGGGLPLVDGLLGGLPRGDGGLDLSGVTGLLGGLTHVGDLEQQEGH